MKSFHNLSSRDELDEQGNTIHYRQNFKGDWKEETYHRKTGQIIPDLQNYLDTGWPYRPEGETSLPKKAR